MKKAHCILIHLTLLIWFFLDMTGLYISDKCLVTRSYKDDGIFFIVYLVIVVLFILKEKVGSRLAIVWLSMWFVIQFICHEWYTIFNDGFMGTLKGKIEYFSETIKWIQIEGKYIPDLYHTILHILIIVALISTVLYNKSVSKNK